ncbi:hypothetical protein [Streptomyces barringtoniae]|uniref:hypothetical protein n=1 Tax=Streptomyces barringtoniae TaxID=2892029 RepID=UPI001E5D24C4|nr:hypothetical protein [Streptomyces barringtoniae]MCC5474477.1 hypothetical protein [Streptomyces barringtoniae]
MERGEGPLEDVAELAQAADVGLASTGDDRRDPTPGQLASDVPTVVTLVTGKGLGPLAWPTGSAGRGRDAVDQGEGLGDGGGVAAGLDHFQRRAAAVADQVVFTARLAAIDRRRASPGTPVTFSVAL